MIPKVFIICTYIAAIQATVIIRNVDTATGVRSGFVIGTRGPSIGPVDVPQTTTVIAGPAGVTVSSQKSSGNYPTPVSRFTDPVSLKFSTPATLKYSGIIPFGSAAVTGISSLGIGNIIRNDLLNNGIVRNGYLGSQVISAVPLNLAPISGPRSVINDIAPASGLVSTMPITNGYSAVDLSGKIGQLDNNMLLGNGLLGNGLIAGYRITPSLAIQYNPGLQKLPNYGLGLGTIY